MGQYTEDTVISVYPYTQQIDEEEVVIGRKDPPTFLVLPVDAFELLNELSEGKTIGQARASYQSKYGENPDINDLLNILEMKGFVQSSLDGQSHFNHSISQSDLESATKNQAARFHFTKFPQSLAQQIFCKQNLMLAGACIGLGLLATITEPSIIPDWSAFFFKENITLMWLSLMFISLLTLFFHEMAHLVAARALGIPSRIGIGNRMWMLVAETDMTEIWSIPRNQRYLPFLAGPLLDAFCASLLALFLYTSQKGFINLHPITVQLCKAVFLNYLLGLIWQCYFFVRTDFYFVFANFFRCKNLMQDTENLLRNQLTRLIPSMHKVSQTHIPRAERRIIQFYSIIWILGRLASFYSLIFIGLPLTWNYFLRIFIVFKTGYSANPSAFIDASLTAVLVLTPQIYGLSLWIRSFNKKRGENYD
jgi:putative peptide zinc metalloprotease protein